MKALYYALGGAISLFMATFVFYSVISHHMTNTLSFVESLLASVGGVLFGAIAGAIAGSGEV